jgi:predicted DNA-binding transcriptional regulator AlpA
MNPKHLTEVQTAKKLGVSKGTLANWRWRKYGPPFLKIGRRIEYLDSDIDEWRKAQRQDPTQPAA